MLRRSLVLLALCSCVATAVVIPLDGEEVDEPVVEPGEDPDRDGDGIENAADCEPDDPEIFPGAIERCDPVDRDCDGVEYTAADCPCDAVVVGERDAYYVGCAERRTWSEAQAICAEGDLQLLIVEDEEATETIVPVISEFGEDVVWIGLSDQDVEGEFRWVDGTGLSYANWGGGHPRQGLRAESLDCALMVRDEGWWVVLACDYEAPFVCQPR